MADYNQLSGGTGQLSPYNSNDPFGMGYGNAQRNQLSSNIGNMSQFGGQLGNMYTGNQAGINNTANGMLGTIGMLQGLANGNNSVSMAQAGQNLAAAQQQQMSQAAAAAPQNQAMAARTAMIQSGNLSGQIAGQQAVAGLQERNQAIGQLVGAQSALGQLQTTQSGQNLNGSLGALNGANQGAGTYLGNAPPNLWNTFGKGAVSGLAGGLGTAY